MPERKRSFLFDKSLRFLLSSSTGHVVCDERRKNLELSEFEVVLFCASVCLILRNWGPWYGAIATVGGLETTPPQIVLLVTAPLACLVLLLTCLLTLSATTVRGHALYIGLYLALGAACLGGFTRVAPFLGISARDDVLERGNSAAAVAVTGALVGSCCAFAGANIGNGPGVEAVSFSAILSLALFVAVWFALEFLTHISEAVTVDRDAGAGIRLCGFLVGAGLLSGWSVAGDWISAVVTVRDFAKSGWPAISLGALTVVVEWLRARTGISDLVGAKLRPSIVIAVMYVSLAVAWVVARGVHS